MNEGRRARRLTYWVAKCETDSDCYSIRAKTKREVVAQAAAEAGINRYSEPIRVEVEYTSVFDLLHLCMGEGAGSWEYAE